MHCWQEQVLRAVENEGSSLSGEIVQKTMDAMYASGELQPREYGHHAGECLARFYNVTGLSVEVEVPGRPRSLIVGAAGSVVKSPWRYSNFNAIVDPGSECLIRIGDYPTFGFFANTDPRQLIFVERNRLPEEQMFETAMMSGGLTAALEKLAEWKKQGGKKRRHETLHQFQVLQPFFQEQVLVLETAIGQQRASLAVDEMQRKVVEASAELESAHDLTGIINQGATCYMNSLLQGLYMTPELRFALYRWQWKAERGESKEESIPYQLQKLFCMMQSAESVAVETKALTVSFGWTGPEAFQQHDVNELFNVFCDSLENNFKGTRGAGVISSLFEGREKQYVRCEVCGFESGREEKCRSVMVNVKQFGDPHPIRSIEEGLDNYYTSERLCGDNQYHCEKCNAKVDAEKGVGLSKVPYLLTIDLKRFVYNWETDRAEKLDDRVEFPETLDVAKYLVPYEKLVAESGGATGGGGPANTDFGKDGASVLMRGRSAIGLVAPDALNYDLYAILIHSGTVAAGHYYAYIRDFEKDQWFEFNDSSVSGPLSTTQWQQAFGGQAVNSYGYWASQGTGYMLMYRRREPKVNIQHVPDSQIPEQVMADIAREEEAAREAASASEAEEERQRDAIPFAVCNKIQMKVVWVKRMHTWGAALQQVHEELNLEPALENIRLNRLESLQPVDDGLRQTSGSTPIVFDCDNYTLVKDVPDLEGAICQVDVKSPGAAWGAAPPRAQTGTAHIHFGAIDGGLDITRYLACDLGVPFKTVAAQIAEVLDVPDNEALQLYNKGNKRVSGLACQKQVGNFLRLSPEWMGQALQVAVGEGATETLCVLLRELETDEYMHTGTIFFVNCSGHPIRIAQETLEWNYIMRMNLKVTKTLETLGGRPTSNSVAASFHIPAVRGATFEISCYSHGFEERHFSVESIHQVVVITDNLQIVDARTFLHAKTGPKPKVQAVATVTTGPRKLPVYRFHGRHDDLSDFLFEVEVDAETMDDMGVVEFKEIIAANMGEVEGLEAALPANLRLCEMGGAVFRDDQTVFQVFDGVVNGSEKIGLTVRGEPEDKESGCKVISVIRYHPELFTLSDDHLEITLETSGYDVSSVRIQNLIAEALGPGGLSADRLSVSCNETAAYGRKTGTVADMKLMDWNYRHALRLSQDNCLFFFKDVDAEELQLTEDEKTERTKRAVLARQRKARQTDTRSAEPAGGEAQIRIRGAGLQTPTSPGGTPELPEPAPAGEEGAGTEVDRTVSAELYHSLLSNSKLTAARRQAVGEMQAKRAADQAAPVEDSGELQQWLSRTPSRQYLARNRRELEILQALGSEPADAQLVRTPSASSQADAAEVERLEEAGTQVEIERVAAEVAKLKEELGLV